MILCALMIVSSLTVFVSTVGAGSTSENEEAFTIDSIREIDSSALRTVGSLNPSKIKQPASNPSPLSPPPEPEAQANFFTDDFEDDVLYGDPDAPPWNYFLELDGAVESFGPYDFESDVVGNHPAFPPWTVSDGGSPTWFWGPRNADTETVGSDPICNYFYELPGADIYVDDTQFYSAPNSYCFDESGITGGGSYRDQMGWTGMGWNDDSYYATFRFYTGPDTGINYGEQIQYMGDVNANWILGRTATQFRAVDGNGAGGGFWSNLGGFAWNTWYLLEIEQDNPGNQFRVRINGGAWSGWLGSLFNGNTVTDAVIFFGGAPATGANPHSQIWLDDIGVWQPAAGGTQTMVVDDTYSQSGGNSLMLDQNSQGTSAIATCDLTTTVGHWGEGTVDYWVHTDTTAADSTGTTMATTDAMNNIGISMRFQNPNIQYWDGAWQNAVGYAANTWYHFTLDFNTTTATYDVTIGGTTYATNVPFRSASCRNIANFVFQGATGTPAETWLDDLSVNSLGSGADIYIDDAWSGSGSQSLHFEERGSQGPNNQVGTDTASGFGFSETFGWINFTFNSANYGSGLTVQIYDQAAGSITMLFGWGVDYTGGGVPDPGVMKWIDGNGAGGGFIFDGSTYNPGETHTISVAYDVGAQTYDAYFDGGLEYAGFGFLQTSTDVGALIFFGDAPDQSCDMFIDDVTHEGPAPNLDPAPPTNCWAEPPGSGPGTYDNYTVNGQFLDHGTITGGDWTDIDEMPPGPPDGNTEDIQEVVGGTSAPVVEGFQATNGGSATSTNLVLDAPAGITPGELLLLIVGNDDNTATAQFGTTPAGWNYIGEGGDNSADAHIGAFWRIADGTEGPTVTVVAQSADNWWGWYIRISGADTTTPINVNNFAQSTGNAGTHNIPQVTTTVDDCLAIYGLAFDGADGYPFSVAAPWTEQDEQQAGTSNTEASGCWGTQDIPTAGGTGIAAVTASVSDGAAYFQLAIQPAPGGAFSLEKRWSTQAIAAGATSLDLYVRARRDAGADDTFTFGYSTALGGPYTGVITVTQTVLTTLSAPIPVMSGSIYINVIDNNNADAAQQDTIYVDTIWIEYFQGGGSVLTVQQTIADNPVEGSVTGTHVLTHPPADGTAQQIDEVAASSTGEPTPMNPGPGPEPMVDLLVEGFEGLATGSGPPAGWTSIDNDGDGQNWYAIDDADGVVMPAHNGTVSMHSASWNGAPLTPDNFMITPQIDLSSYINARVRWWSACQDPAWPSEHYEVWISTTGNAVGDFTDQVYEYTEINDVWQLHTVDLSAYDGQQIYIAWRHNECTDWFRLKMDDVIVSADLAGNSLEHIWTLEDMPADSLSRDLYVTARHNTGSDDSFSFEWAQNIGGPWNPTTITVNTDVFQTYSDSISVGFVGPLYVRVVDDNGGDSTLDSVYIDEIRVESYVSAVSTDVVIHWDLSIDDGGGENDVVQYNIYRADEEDGDDLTGPYTYIGSAPAGATTYNDIGEGADTVNQAWYYVEAQDAGVPVKYNQSGFFSKLNFAPIVQNVQANGMSPVLTISPFTPSVTLTAEAIDNSSNYEAIPKMDYAEYYVDVDPGQGSGIEIFPDDAIWDMTFESMTGTIDTSLWGPGTYIVYVRASEDHTLGAMGSRVYGVPSSVTIDVVDGPPVADAGPDQTEPQHTLVTFDGSASYDDVGITNYWWNFTDVTPQSLTGVSPPYTFDNEGVFLVTLTVMDTIGQTGSDTMIVNITDGDPPMADAGPDQSDVPGANIIFDGSASFDPGHMGEPIINGIVNWTWDFVDGGAVQLFGVNPMHQFFTPGIYTVTLTVTDQVGLTDTDTMDVTIQQIFDIDISEAALSADWILMSFPNQIEGDPLTTIVDLGGDTQWDIVQWYDPTDPQPWKTTATFKPPVLNDFNYVNNTYAFWIHITVYGDGIITIVGDLAASGEQAVYNLKTGWNLVGYPFPVAQPAANTFGTAFSIADAMTYDSADPYRVRFYDWFGENHEPGEGYWVFCLGDEDLVIGAP
jgi:hypothetical protein